MSGGTKTQGPGSDEQALASISGQAFERQKEVYNPVIKKYSAQADNGTAINQRVAGSSNVATQQAFSQATPGAVSTALRRGGSVGDTLAGVEAGKTQSEASGQSSAVSKGKNIQLSELGQVIGFGRGQTAQATYGLGQVGELQTKQELQNAQLAADQSAQIGSGVLSAAAFGAGALGYGASGGSTPSTTSFNGPENSATTNSLLSPQDSYNLGPDVQYDLSH